MRPEDPPGVTVLLDGALQLSGDDREAYLARECANDDGLRQEIDALLEAEAESDITSFLARSVLDEIRFQSPEAPTTEIGALQEPAQEERIAEVPERIGPFRILSELGAGGMGTVYLAEQREGVERRVALKVIHAVSHAQWRQRFDAECRALARLSHPNIAALYEVGSTERQGVGEAPYVVMELVDGEAIHHWCDRQPASIERRLELFLDVCSAVSHAHRNRILHCDLKPSNVLVTREEGRVKVIDFGIARTLDESRRAESVGGEPLMGSPPYISPELVLKGREHLDTRADVYSLGLILYELLVGVLPFEATGQLVLLMRVVEKDPQPPSIRWRELSEERARQLSEARLTNTKALARRIRGDLDAIVLKAIERDPDRRYGSVVELAADVRRHLEHQPILARPSTTSYVLGRFVRRHVHWVVAGLLLVAALATGFVARTVEARRANAEAQRATRALAESEQISRFLVDLFRASDPDSARAAPTTVREVLDKGSLRLREELTDQPLTRARLLQTVGSIYTELGQLQEAGELVAEALEIRLRELPLNHVDVVASQSELGIIFRRSGRYKEAEELLSAVLAARQSDPDTDPELLARAHSHLGLTLWRLQRYEDAETRLRQALELRQGRGNMADEAESANNLGAFLQHRYRLEEARVLLLRAVEIFRQELGERHLRVAAAINNLGMVERRLKSWRQAEQRFQQAEAMMEEAYGELHPNTLEPRLNLVQELILLRKWDEAAREAQEIVDLATRLESPITLVKALRFQSRVHRLSGNGLKAIGILEQCHAVALNELGPRHSATLGCLRNRAQALRSVGEYDQAFAILEEVAEIQDESLGAQHPSRNQTRLILGVTAHEAGDYATAELYHRKYLEALEQREGSPPLKTATGLHNLGRALYRQGQYEEAVSSLQQAFELRQSSYGNGHPRVADTAYRLAQVELARGELERATELAELAVQIQSDLFAEDDSGLAEARKLLAEISGSAQR